MSKLEVEMVIDGVPTVFLAAPTSGITWEYIAGYYDASGTVTQGWKNDEFLETRLFVWSKDEGFLEQLRGFLGREPNNIRAGVESVAKRKYPRWRLRIGRREDVVRFAQKVLQFLRVEEKREGLLDAMKQLEKYCRK